MSQTTLFTIPKLISQVLKVYDVDTLAIFKKVGINLIPSDNNNTRVSMDQMQKLWELSVQATGNPELGLVAAELFQPAYLKGLGLSWMASATLEEGLRRFAKNSQLMNTVMRLELLERDDDLLIQYRSQTNIEPVLKGHQCAIQLGVGFFLKMFCLAAGKRIPATAVYFTFDLGSSLSVYENYFQCPVHGNSKVSGIAFSRSLLNELLPTHDSELVALNEAAVAKYINSMQAGFVSNKVVNAVTDSLALGCPSEETIAFKLNMSKRTLQRRLNAEGQSYSALLHSLRIALAKQYLTSKNISVTEITYQLGYSSPSTFARAFKQLVHCSPVQYREQHS